MPKSEFNKQLAVRGGQVTVSGVVDPDTTARATKSGADVDVHWVVEQGDVVAQGHDQSPGAKFTQKDQRAQPWKDGPARATGVAVTVQRAPAVAIETFSWSQEVELTVT